MPDSGRSEVRISHSTGKANPKQMAASASAKKVLRLQSGKPLRNSGRVTIGIELRPRDAVDDAVRHHAKQEDDEPADDRRPRSAAAIEIEEGEHIGIEAEQFSGSAGTATGQGPHDIEGTEGVDGADDHADDDHRTQHWQR